MNFTNTIANPRTMSGAKNNVIVQAINSESVDFSPILPPKNLLMRLVENELHSRLELTVAGFTNTSLPLKKRSMKRFGIG